MASREVEEFLAGFPPEVEALALETRALILKFAPKAEEMADAPARIIGYGFGKKYADMVFVIIPSKGGVGLGFYRGADLPDPKRLLEGTGKVHRHVKLRKPADLKRAGLGPLLKAAITAWKRRVQA